MKTNCRKSQMNTTDSKNFVLLSEKENILHKMCLKGEDIVLANFPENNNLPHLLLRRHNLPRIESNQIKIQTSDSYNIMNTYTATVADKNSVNNISSVSTQNSNNSNVDSLSTLSCSLEFIKSHGNEITEFKHSNVSRNVYDPYNDGCKTETENRNGNDITKKGNIYTNESIRRSNSPVLENHNGTNNKKGYYLQHLGELSGNSSNFKNFFEISSFHESDSLINPLSNTNKYHQGCQGVSINLNHSNKTFRINNHNNNIYNNAIRNNESKGNSCIRKNKIMQIHHTTLIDKFTNNTQDYTSNQSLSTNVNINYTNNYSINKINNNSDNSNSAVATVTTTNHKKHTSNCKPLFKFSDNKNTPAANNFKNIYITNYKKKSITILKGNYEKNKSCSFLGKVNTDKNVKHFNNKRKNGGETFNGETDNMNVLTTTECNCLTEFRAYILRENSKTNINQIHCDILNIIIMYLYQQQILPEVNEIKRKINKYIPLCESLNTNFLSICEEDKFDRFYVCNSLRGLKLNKTPSQKLKQSLEESKKIKRVENMCIFLKGVPDAFFIDPNEDYDNITNYIPIVFIHLLDRFRFQTEKNIHKGGRYIMAESLKETGPYCFRVMALGRIIRILQKCIDLNILSYSNNNIIPNFISESVSQTFLSKIKMDRSPQLKYKKEKYINLVKSRIKRLLNRFIENDKSENSNKKGFALSVLPRVYKNVYGEDLNIEKLGYSKLNEFITNELSDICYVSLAEKFQCKIVAVNGEKKVESDKEAKLQKIEETQEFLKYISNYGWSNRISFFFNCLFYKSNIKNMSLWESDFKYMWESFNKDALYVDREIERRGGGRRIYPRTILQNTKEDMIDGKNGVFKCPNNNININGENKNYKAEKTSILLPLDTTIPSFYDGKKRYRNLPTYYSVDENEDTTCIHFLEPTKKYDLMHDIKKSQTTKIKIEENINLYNIYKNAYAVYSAYHELFEDCDIEIQHEKNKV